MPRERIGVYNDFSFWLCNDATAADAMRLQSALTSWHTCYTHYSDWRIQLDQARGFLDVAAAPLRLEGEPPNRLAVLQEGVAAAERAAGDMKDMLFTGAQHLLYYLLFCFNTREDAADPAGEEVESVAMDNEILDLDADDDEDPCPATLEWGVIRSNAYGAFPGHRFASPRRFRGLVRFFAHQLPLASFARSDVTRCTHALYARGWAAKTDAERELVHGTRSILSVGQWLHQGWERLRSQGAAPKWINYMENTQLHTFNMFLLRDDAGTLLDLASEFTALFTPVHAFFARQAIGAVLPVNDALRGALWPIISHEYEAASAKAKRKEAAARAVGMQKDAERAAWAASYAEKHESAVAKAKLKQAAAREEARIRAERKRAWLAKTPAPAPDE